MWVGRCSAAIWRSKLSPPQSTSTKIFFGKLGVAEKLLADLLRQLAGGGDDEALDFLGFRVHLRQQRQAEGGGLAGAGLGLGDQVAAVFQQERDRLVLDFRGM